MSLHPKFQLTAAKAAFIGALIMSSMFASAGPYRDLQLALKSAKTPQQVIDAVTSERRLTSQPDIKRELDGLSDPETDRAATASDLRAMVDLGAMAEDRKPSPTSQSQAKKIKDSPLYSDQGIDRKKNWLGDALSRLKNLKLKDDTKPNLKSPDLSPVGEFVKLAIWILLVAAVLILLYYAIRYIDWRKALTRRTKALIEDDEPERTLDEWLELADQHAANGRYREAVRALYLACLLRFDENNVARFDRGETNWEHLARIMASPTKPEDVDFTEPTKRFDRIWYGFQTQGQPDVDLFRVWYKNLTEQLKVPH